MSSTSSSHIDEEMAVTRIIKESKRGNPSEIELDVEKLEHVLMNPKYSDYPVAIYTIAGPLRSGKSFLQNLISHHLAEQKEPENKPKDVVEETFHWRSGIDRDTEGIYITTKPILLDDKDNSKVALFLMDTQGLFDHEASTQTATIIGTLSFLLSSLQFFNVKGRINSQYLEHIYKFAELASDVKKHNSTSLFQKGSLMFIVRDWDEVGYPHGAEGGKKYFSKVMEPKKERAREHELMRNYLHETFGEISCFLFPHPGSVVRKKENVCHLSELDETFLEKTKEFIQSIFGKNLMVKEMNGKRLTCADLYNYMKAYAPVVQNGIAKNIESFIEDLRFERNYKLSEMKDEVLLQYNESALSIGDEKFQEEWKTECFNLMNQIALGMKDCLGAEDEYWKKIDEFRLWQKENFNEVCLLADEEKGKVQVYCNQLLADFKQKIHPDISHQCCSYLNSVLKKILVETKEKIDEFLIVQRSVQLQIAIIMGALCERAPTTVDVASVEVVKQQSGSYLKKIPYVGNYFTSKTHKTERKWCLKKFENGIINFQLCFGNVSFPLFCKVH